jgi:hypothetical protein
MDSDEMKTSDYELVPYEQVEPGFEAAYTGERINVRTQRGSATSHKTGTAISAC